MTAVAMNTAIRSITNWPSLSSSEPLVKRSFLRTVSVNLAGRCPDRYETGRGSGLATRPLCQSDLAFGYVPRSSEGRGTAVRSPEAVPATRDPHHGLHRGAGAVTR